MSTLRIKIKPQSYKIIYANYNWHLIQENEGYRWLTQLTKSNKLLLIPRQAHLEICLHSLSQFGALLNFWGINQPRNQISQILFQDDTLLRFSLKGSWGFHRFFIPLRKPLSSGMTSAQTLQWLRQFMPTLPKEIITLPQTGFKALSKLPPPPCKTTPSLNPLSPLSESLKTTAPETYGYDINSLYPFCMLLPFPTGKPEINKIMKLKNLFGLAEAQITVKDCTFPATPHLKNHRSQFGVGTWKGLYFSEELKYMQQLGYSVQLKKTWNFQNTTYIPSLPLLNLFQQKQFTQDSGFKIWLNSIYGRLAFSKRKPLTWVEKKTNSEFRLKSPIPQHPWNLTRQSRKLNNPNPYRIWGSLIVSYGRIYLHQLTAQHSQSIQYLDTDALFSSYPWSPQSQGRSLGQFKYLWGQTKHKGIFISPKAYITQGEGNPTLKMRGISNPEPKEFWDLMKQLKTPSVNRLKPFSLSPRRHFLSRTISFPFHSPLPSRSSS